VPADAAAQLLHAMLPVADLGRSLEFYREHFGLTEIRRISFPEIPRTLVFMASTEAGAAAMQLELWHEPGVWSGGSAAPDHAGTRLHGHIGIAVAGIDAFVARLATRG
jgi:catechol 2,3-dioxygenase-like lactoylglutathione lyase family enzyme